MKTASSLGDDLAAKMSASRARKADVTDGWVDDDGSVVGAGDADGTVVPLTPLGPQIRPNGAEYRPRHIGGFEDIALLRDARTRKEHVLFSGPPGTGKTALAEAAFVADAKAEHDGFEAIVGTADTTEADFVGTFVQNPKTGLFQWHPGPLHRSVIRNVPLIVDEIALIDPRVLSVLYGLMDGRGVLRIAMNPELDPMPVGDGWFVVAAYNPDVPGAVLSPALRDRFEHHIVVGTDWELAREMGVPDDVVEVAELLDDKRRKHEISWSPQLRTLLSYRQMASRRGRRYALANLLSKAPAEDRVVIAKVMTAKITKWDSEVLQLGARFTS